MLILLLLLQLWNLQEIRARVTADPAVLEQRDAQNRTLLTAAVADGQKKAVSLLLELGAKPDEPEALALAAAAGNTDIARILMAGKANPNLPFEGKSPIFYAIENNKRAMVLLLADNGTDLDKPLPVVGAPLHWAAEKATPEIMLALLNPPTNVKLETKDEAGQTALQRAIVKGRVEAARLLLNYGAEPLDGLELARQSGNPAMIQLLEHPPAVKPGHREIKIRM